MYLQVPNADSWSLGHWDQFLAFCGPVILVPLRTESVRAQQLSLGTCDVLHCPLRGPFHNEQVDEPFSVISHNLTTEAPCVLVSAATGMSTSCAPTVLRASYCVQEQPIYSCIYCHDTSFSGTEEGVTVWKSRPSGLTGLDVYQCLGETRWLVLEDPGAGVLPTCFLTPILLPVNSAALQPEWPDRTLWVLAALLLCPASGWEPCFAQLQPACDCQLHPGSMLGCEQKNQKCSQRCCALYP